MCASNVFSLLLKFAGPQKGWGLLLPGAPTPPSPSGSTLFVVDPASANYLLYIRALHRENKENGQKNSLLGKCCQNTGNLVCASCKFPYSKGKRCFDICRENFQFFFLSWISLPSQFCVCNSHKARNLTQGRCDQTGKTQGI